MRYLFPFVLLISLESFAGDTTKLYNPKADVKKDLAAAICKSEERRQACTAAGGR